MLTHQNITADADLPLGVTGASTLRRTTNLGEMTSSLAMRLIQFTYNLLYVLRARLQEEQDREEGEEKKGDQDEQDDKKKKKSSKRESKKKNKRSSLET